MARLVGTMEMTHTAGRRILPPVPRPPAEAIRPASQAAAAQAPADAGMDAGQQFVAQLRAHGRHFADAAGAESAVVREVVPPARHRRSRCWVVLRYAGGTESDLTFVGERRRPGSAAADRFDADIARWLSAGQLHDPAWLVPDPGAPDGLAVDVTVWLATG